MILLLTVGQWYCLGRARLQMREGAWCKPAVIGPHTSVGALWFHCGPVWDFFFFFLWLFSLAFFFFFLFIYNSELCCCFRFRE